MYVRDAQWLFRLMRQRGLTQSGLARAIRKPDGRAPTPQALTSLFVAGHVSAPLARSIADALGVDVDTLFGPDRPVVCPRCRQSSPGRATRQSPAGTPGQT